MRCRHRCPPEPDWGRSGQSGRTIGSRWRWRRIIRVPRSSSQHPAECHRVNRSVSDRLVSTRVLPGGPAFHSPNGRRTFVDSVKSQGGRWNVFKVRFLAIPAASAMLLLGGAAVSADSSPVPGATGSAQPVSASAGSAGVSTGRAGTNASSSGASGSHCGVSAGAAGTGYNAQPAQAGTNGTSTPTCSSGSTSGGGGATQGAPNQGQGGSSDSTGNGATAGSGATTGTPAGNGIKSGTRSSDLASLDFGSASGNQGAARSATWLWLLLALAAGLLIFFIGAVIGSRRRKESQQKAAA
jgi:hypothetical protein